MSDKRQTTRGIVLCAMLVGVSVVLMMVSAMAGSGRLGTLVLLSLTPIILLSRGYRAIAWAGYGATLLCGFLMVSDKMMPIAYGLFFGIYPFLWQLSRKGLPAWVGWLLRWGIFSVGYGLLLLILHGQWPFMPILALILLGQAFFVLYNLIYGRCVEYFMARWAPIIEKWERGR